MSVQCVTYVSGRSFSLLNYFRRIFCGRREIAVHRIRPTGVFRVVQSRIRRIDLKAFGRQQRCPHEPAQ